MPANDVDFKQAPFGVLWSAEGGAEICPTYSNGGNYCFIGTKDDPTRITFKVYLQNAKDLSFRFRLGNWADGTTRQHTTHLSYTGAEGTWTEVDDASTESFAAGTNVKEGTVVLPASEGGARYTGVVYLRASMSGAAGRLDLVGWDIIRMGCPSGCEAFYLVPAGAGGMGGALAAPAAADGDACDAGSAGALRYVEQSQELEVCRGAAGAWTALSTYKPPQTVHPGVGSWINGKHADGSVMWHPGDRSVQYNTLGAGQGYSHIRSKTHLEGDFTVTFKSSYSGRGYCGYGVIPASEPCDSQDSHGCAGAAGKRGTNVVPDNAAGPGCWTNHNGNSEGISCSMTTGTIKMTRIGSTVYLFDANGKQLRSGDAAGTDAMDIYFGGQMNDCSFTEIAWTHNP